MTTEQGQAYVREAKKEILLECQEASELVTALNERARKIALAFERFGAGMHQPARTFAAGEATLGYDNPLVIDRATLPTHDEALSLCADIRAANAQLQDALQRKRELGLR